MWIMKYGQVQPSVDKCARIISILKLVRCSSVDMNLMVSVAASCGVIEVLGPILAVVNCRWIL